MPIHFRATLPFILAFATAVISASAQTAPMLTVSNSTPATSIAAAPSPPLILSGQFWNGSVSATDTWTIQNSIGNGTNGLASLAFTHSGSTAAEINLLSSKLVLSGAGIFSKIGNISTAGNLGVPVVEGIANYTAYTSSLTHVDLIGSTGTAGSFTIHYYVDQNQVSGCSGSTLNVTFNWNDGVNARSFSTGTLTLGNTQGPNLYTQGNLNIWAAQSVNIYLTTVAVGTGTTCSYDLHAWIDQSQTP
ncbi:MAG: hypothetical protein LAO09_18945 [Acidobacteriia bacterium]|nr:hypothetical protein [Terriglobia bacterium]